MSDPSLTERVRLLESHVSVQEELLVAMQAERIEAERLNESVERLGTGATALGEALREVDRQQQLLTRLGREVKEVQDKTDEIDAKVVSKAELDALEREKERVRVEREQEAEDERQRHARLLAAKERARRRRQAQTVTMWSVLVGVLMSTGVLVAMVSSAANEREELRFRQDVYDICQARAVQAQRVQALITREPPEDADAAEARKLLLAAFPIIPCEELKP